MATESLEPIDEFFDFAQLEKDTANHDTPQQYEVSGETVPFPDLDSAMDWQPTASDETGVFATLPSEFVPGGSVQSIDQIVCTAPFACVEPLGNAQYPPISNALSPACGFTAWPTEGSGTQAVDEPQLDDLVIDMPSIALNDPSPIIEEPRQPAKPQRNSTITRKPASAKRKGPSTRIPVEARQMLEEEFAANPYPCSWEIDIIAHQANLDVKRVRNWFNNTRARKKPESSGRYLSIFFDSYLT